MPKGSNIKWRKSDKDILRKAVNRFNAKRTRVIKKDPLMEQFQPSRAQLKKITDLIATRADFNKTIKDLDKYLVKGAETPVMTKKGVPTTKWQLAKLKAEVRVINRRRGEERKKLQPSIEKGNLHTVEELALKDRKGPDEITNDLWIDYVFNSDKQAKPSYYQQKMELYKANYLKGLDSVFGGLGEDIAVIVRGLTASQVVDALYSNTLYEIDYIYDYQDMMNKHDTLVDIWNDFAGTVGVEENGES